MRKKLDSEDFQAPLLKKKRLFKSVPVWVRSSSVIAILALNEFIRFAFLAKLSFGFG